MMNRQVTHFSVGNKIYWFDGSSNSEKPVLVPMVVVCVQINEIGRVIVSASEALAAEQCEISLRSIPEDSNWRHSQNGPIHTFVITNPWFLSEEEVRELSATAKEKFGHLQVLRWLSEVRLQQGSRTTEFMNATVNWATFWKKHKVKK